MKRWLLLAVLCPAISSAGLINISGGRGISTPDPGGEFGYLSDLNKYEARALTGGTYGPASGDEDMLDVTPAEWIAASNVHQSCVISAWAGGGKGNGTKLLFRGCGHNDGDNNGTYIYDFDVDGNGRPLGFESPLLISDLADVQNGHVYADGLVSGYHTYDGLVWFEALNGGTAYQIAGVARSAGGGFDNSTFKYNAGAWSAENEITDYPGCGGCAIITIVDHTSGKFFAAEVAFAAGNIDARFFDTADDTWSSSVSTGLDDIGETSACWDYTRNRGFIPQQWEGVLYPGAVIELNFSAETVVDSDQLAFTGDTAITPTNEGSKVSCVFDEDTDRFWLFGGDSDSPGYGAIYEIDAASTGTSWAIIVHDLSWPSAGDETTCGAQTSLANVRGSYGRYVFMRDQRAIGYVSKYNSPACVIKLPLNEADL